MPTLVNKWHVTVLYRELKWLSAHIIPQLTVSELSCIYIRTWYWGINYRKITEKVAEKNTLSLNNSRISTTSFGILSLQCVAKFFKESFKIIISCSNYIILYNPGIFLVAFLTSVEKSVLIPWSCMIEDSFKYLMLEDFCNLQL